MANSTIELVPNFAGLFPSKGTMGVAANTKILKGTIVVRDANGDAGLPGAGLHAHGIAAHTVDNTGGAAGALSIEVEFGVFGLAYTGTAPKPGEWVFVSDNQTVTLTASTNGNAGPVSEVRNGRAYVTLSPIIAALAVEA